MKPNENSEKFEKTSNQENNLNTNTKKDRLKRKKIIDNISNKYNLSYKESEYILQKLEKSEINAKKEKTTKKPQKQNTQKKEKTTKQVQQNQPDIDKIMSELIPDYNQTISIELEHVNVTFDVETDNVDTLKESVIKTLKRNKSQKIQFKALKDISFKIYNGEKVGIIGYNGAGKSTLLKVICGIYEPDDGIVKTNGNISPLLSLGAGFDSNYSGRRNIFLNGAVLGYSKEFLESKMEEIIEFAELGKFIDFPIRNYSSGMLAKLGFSIATIVEPDILIIDEILSVGDMTFAKKSNDKIKSLMNGGTTVILVSHSIPQIREICDKAIWIDNGEIREIGEVNKVCDNYIKDSEKASNKQIANIQLDN